VWLKVHDSYDSAAIGGLDFPLDCSRAVIYLLRDPRDVCVSLAHHLGVTIDQALSMMGNDQLSLNRQGVPLPEQFAQWLGRWDRHVQAWLERCPMTPLCLRYEDLLQDTAASLRRVLAWTAQTADEEAIGRAIERCRFSRLAAEEARSGFAERPRQSVRFFRSGRAGGWRDTLTVSQAARIESEFGPVMRRMGYLDGEGAA
jgi:hypothetical protein